MIIEAQFEELTNEKPVDVKAVKKSDRFTFHDIALLAFGIGLMVFSKALFSYLTYRG